MSLQAKHGVENTGAVLHKMSDIVLKYTRLGPVCDGIDTCTDGTVTMLMGTSCHRSSCEASCGTDSTLQK